MPWLKRKYGTKNEAWYTYDLHAISIGGRCTWSLLPLQVLISINYIKVLIGFYRLLCQVVLKYLCKVETIHFRYYFFSNSCCRPWNSTFVFFHLPTITMNSDPNNCSKLWPLSLWACEKIEKEASRGGMLCRFSPRAGTNLLPGRTSMTQKCVSFLSKGWKTLNPLFLISSFYVLFCSFL